MTGWILAVLALFFVQTLLPMPRGRPSGDAGADARICSGNRDEAPAATR